MDRCVEQYQGNIVFPAPCGERCILDINLGVSGNTLVNGYTLARYLSRLSNMPRLDMCVLYTVKTKTLLGIV